MARCQHVVKEGAPEYQGAGLALVVMLGYLSLLREALSMGRWCANVICLPAEAFLSVMLRLGPDFQKAH